MKIYCAYLPQFHRTEKNDFFWGRGFTDWTSTKKAKRLFKGHKQPLKPGILGEYNLLNKKILKIHSKMMNDAGIDAFGVYYYHFKKKLFALNEPLKIIKKNNDINFKFFLYWVNSDWTKSWIGKDKVIIYKQDDSLRHAIKVVENAISYFKDDRYEKIDNRPIFIIHEPYKFNLKKFKLKTNKLLKKKKLRQLYLVGNLNYIKNKSDIKLFDEVINWPPDSLFLGKFKNFLRILLPEFILKFEVIFKYCSIKDYKEYLTKLTHRILILSKTYKNFSPSLITNWDNTPRYFLRGILLKNVNPDYFYKKVLSIIPELKKNNTTFIFIKAWNEWAEGNVIEHSQKYKYKFIKVIKKLKKKINEL